MKSLHPLVPGLFIHRVLLEGRALGESSGGADSGGGSSRQEFSLIFNRLHLKQAGNLSLSIPRRSVAELLRDNLLPGAGCHG